MITLTVWRKRNVPFPCRVSFSKLSKCLPPLSETATYALCLYYRLLPMFTLSKTAPNVPYSLSDCFPCRLIVIPPIL